MWRESDAGNYSLDAAVTKRAASHSETSEGVPTPGEVFLEAGAVLAGALGLALAAGWLLTAMGIPN
jgi:hypothetical protein